MTWIYFRKTKVEVFNRFQDFRAKRLNLIRKHIKVLRRMVIGLLNLQVEHDGICRGCALCRSAKGSFLSSDNWSKGILDLVPSDACGPRTVSYLGVF